MTNRVVPLAAALCFLAAVTSPAAAAEVNFDASFHSHYVWRGITLTDGPVFQPSMTASQGRFSGNVWGNLDLDDANDLSGEFTEIDLTVSYSVITEGPMTLDVGLIEYAFPASAASGTREVYASFGFGSVVSPSFSIYYDFDEIEDLYANLGISFGSELRDAWSWGLALSVGYAGEDFAAGNAGGTDAGFFDGIANLSVGYERDSFGFGAYVAYVENLDSDALPDQPTDVYGGFNLSWTFD